MYPSPSDWNNAELNSAWVVRSEHVCATSGWDLLFGLQLQLHDRVAAGMFRDWDGRVVTAPQPNDPTQVATGWDDQLLRVLYGVASADRAPASYLAAIRSDAASRSISAQTLAVAVWVAYYNSGYVAGSGEPRYGIGSPAEIGIPAGTQLPTYGAVPPIPPSERTGGFNLGMDCSTPATPDTLGGLGVQPFQFNPLVVFGLLIGAVVVTGLLVKEVPVKRTKR